MNLFGRFSTGKLEFSILRGETANVAQTTQPRKKRKYVHSTEYIQYFIYLLIRRYVMYVQTKLNLHLTCSASGILFFLPFGFFFFFFFPSPMSARTF